MERRAPSCSTVPLRGRQGAALCAGVLLACLTSGCSGPPSALIFGVSADEAWASPDALPPMAPGAGRIFVTNNLEDRVSVLDLDAAIAEEPMEIAKVPVGLLPLQGEGPHHCAFDAAGARVFVGISNFVTNGGGGPHGAHGTGTADGHVLAIDAVTGETLGSVRIDRNPGDVRVAPRAGLVLATHYDLVKLAEAKQEGAAPDAASARLAVIDAVTLRRRAMVTVCPAPHGIALTADEHTAVLACRSDEVALVDLTDPTFPDPVAAVRRVSVLATPGTADLPTCSPYAVAIDDGAAGGPVAWVSCLESGQVIAVDITTGTRTGAVVQLPGRAAFGEVRDRVLAVAHQDQDGVAFIDVDSGQMLSDRAIFPDTCVLPHFARFSPDGSRIWLVCEGDKQDPGTFAILDASAPHATRATTPLGLYPDDMAFARRTE